MYLILFFSNSMMLMLFVYILVLRSDLLEG